MSRSEVLDDAPRHRLHRLHRVCSSPHLHLALAFAASVALWATWALDEFYVWAFTVLGMTGVAIVMSIAVVVALTLDLRRDRPTPGRTALLAVAGALLVQLVAHWYLLLHTPLGC